MRILAGVNSISNRERLVGRCCYPLRIRLVIRLAVRIGRIGSVIKCHLAVNTLNTRRVRQRLSLHRLFMFEIERCTQAGYQCDQDPHNSQVRPNFNLIHDYQTSHNLCRTDIPALSIALPETLLENRLGRRLWKCASFNLEKRLLSQTRFRINTMPGWRLP